MVNFTASHLNNLDSCCMACCQQRMINILSRAASSMKAQNKMCSETNGLQNSVPDSWSYSTARLISCKKTTTCYRCYHRLTLFEFLRPSSIELVWVVFQYSDGCKMQGTQKSQWTRSWSANPLKQNNESRVLIFVYSRKLLLMVQKSQITTWDVSKQPINNGMNHQPQLVIAGFLNHQQWLSVTSRLSAESIA